MGLLVCLFGPHLVMLRSFSWLCIQNLVAVASGDHVGYHGSTLGQPNPHYTIAPALGLCFRGSVPESRKRCLLFIKAALKGMRGVCGRVG